MILKFRINSEKIQREDRLKFKWFLRFKWLMIDNVSEMTFLDVANEAKNMKELEQLTDFVPNEPTEYYIYGHDWGSLEEDFKRPLIFNMINFKKDGIYRRAVFNDVLYICNDDGKTIEKVEGGCII